MCTVYHHLLTFLSKFHHKWKESEEKHMTAGFDSKGDAAGDRMEKHITV